MNGSASGTARARRRSDICVLAALTMAAAGCSRSSRAPGEAPPAVLSIQPGDGATGVPVSSIVQVAFDRALDPASLTTATVALVAAGARPIAGSLAYDAATWTVTFTPSAALGFWTAHELRVATGLRAENGTALERAFRSTFTTAADPADHAPPSILATSPLDGATAVPRWDTVAVTFDEWMEPASLTSSTFLLTVNGAPAAGTIVWDFALRTATFFPAAQLPWLAACVATVTAGATDLAGNPLAQPLTWSFTVEPDTVPPALATVFPADGATSVAVASLLSVTFDEPVDPATVGTASFVLRGPSGLVPASVSYDTASRTATLSPAAPLVHLGAYRATVTTAVADVAGNHLFSDRSWTFTAEPDRVPPSVVAVSPPDGATGVAATAAIRVCFDEPLYGPGTLRVDGVRVALDLDLGGACVQSLQPLTLAPGATVTVTIEGAFDVAGNAMAATFRWTFTVAPDTTPPAVTSSLPVPGARFVPTTAVVSFTFSEAMDAASVTSALAAAGVPGTVAMPDATTATFTPSAPLAAGTWYTVTVGTGARDLAGNALAAPHVLQFQTAPATTAALASPGIASTASPAVAVDTAGNAMAAWIIDTGTGDLVAAAYRPAGGAWGSEQVIDVLPETRVTDLTLVPQGGGFGLAYVRNKPDRWREVVFRFATGAGWDPEQVFPAACAEPVTGLRLLAGSSAWFLGWGYAQSARVETRIRSGSGNWSERGLWSRPWGAAANGDRFVAVGTEFGPAVTAYVWDGSWAGTTTLSDLWETYGGDIGSIAVVPGPAGVAVAWTHTKHGPPDVTTVVTRVLAAGAWQPRQILRSAPDAPASRLLGAATATTQALAFSQGALYVAVRDGAGFTLETVPGGDGPPVAFEANGASFALAWSSGGGTSVATRTSSWGSALSLAGAASPVLVPGADGFALAYDAGALAYARILSAGAWGAATPLGADTRGTALARSGAGYALLWSAGAAVSQADSTTGWSAPTNLMTGAYPASAVDPVIAVRGGRAALAWRQFDASSRTPLVYAATHDGAAWSAPVLLDPDGGTSVSVIPAGSGRFAVHWLSGGGFRRLRVYDFSTSSWSSRADVAPPSAAGIFSVAQVGAGLVAVYDDAGVLVGATSADGATWTPLGTWGTASDARLVASGGTTLLIKVEETATWPRLVATPVDGAGLHSPEQVGTLSSWRTVVVAEDGAGGVGAAFDADGYDATTPIVAAVTRAGTSWTTGGWAGVGPQVRLSGSGGSWLVAHRYYQSFAVEASARIGGVWGTGLLVSSCSADHSAASAGASQCVLVTEEPLPPAAGGPRVTCLSTANASGSALLDALPGRYLDAALGGDPLGTAMVAAWTRAAPSTAARVLRAAVAP